MKDNFCNFYKPDQHWINKIFLQTKMPCILLSEFCSFRIDLLKWQLNYMLCKFGFAISNQTCAACSFNSEITLSDQIALHSIQLPL